MRVMFAVAIALLSLSGAQAQEGPRSCSGAQERCLTPRRGNCDAQCQAYCTAQKAQCMTSGTFATRNNSWSGLAKR